MINIKYKILVIYRDLGMHSEYENTKRRRKKIEIERAINATQMLWMEI